LADQYSRFFGGTIFILGARAEQRALEPVNLSVERLREFGSVHLALALWRRLGLHKLLSEVMGEGREDVPGRKWQPY
jgi:hypothetical protein